MLHPIKHYKSSYHRRKALTVVGTVVATLAIFSGAAFAAAWFEGNGSTTSTETTGVAMNTPEPVQVNALSPTDALIPGGPAGNVKVWVTNTNPEAVHVSSVVVSVTGTSNPLCTAADFTVTQPIFGEQAGGPAVTLPFTLQTGGDTLTTGANYGGTDATIAMIPTAPGDCSGVTVNLSEVAS
jgi:hypothetical protein